MRFLFLLFCLVATINFTFAADNTANYTLPAISPATPNTGPAGWVSNLYQFALLGSGLLAFGVIVYAGFMYALRPGNPSAQSDARDRIAQALLGLLLLLGAFIILRTINPQLVNLPTKFGFTELQQTTQTSPNSLGVGQSTESTQRPIRPGATGVLTDAEAKNNLAPGIAVKNGASLEGIRSETVDEVNNLRNSCSLCKITITEGTAGTHSTKFEESHANGYKVDLRADPSVNNFITSNFTKIQDRIESDGSHTPQWQSPTGGIYARENNHWDVLVKS